MSRILSTLAILCLVRLTSAADATTSQSSLVSASLLYSAAVQVFSGTNSTEWASGKPWYTVLSASTENVKFGASATSNGTIYAYGIQASSASPYSISGVVRRSLNATLIASATTSPIDYAVIADATVTTTIALLTATSYVAATGPGYLAILSSGTASTNSLVQVTVISTSATSVTPVTASASVATSTNTFTLGNIWYDLGSGAFFFTYILTTTGTAACTVYLGGVTASTGALYWAAPGLSVVTSGTDTYSNAISGSNNWTNSTNILVAYKDTTNSKTYLSSTTKSSTTTTAGSSSVLTTDVTYSGTTSPVTTGLTYVPIGIWAANSTYGVAVSLLTQTASSTYTYSIQNFLSGATTGSDSGLTNGTSAVATKLIGWPLTTGYTLLGEYAGTSVTESTSYPTITSYIGNFYANGSANTTVGVGTLTNSLAGPFNVFPDINGTMWIGWTDIDGTIGNIYNLYVARLEGQIYSSTSSANAITTLMAFVAFCLVSVLAL